MRMPDADDVAAVMDDMWERVWRDFRAFHAKHDPTNWPVAPGADKPRYELVHIDQATQAPFKVTITVEPI